MVSIYSHREAEKTLEESNLERRSLNLYRATERLLSELESDLVDWPYSLGQLLKIRDWNLKTLLERGERGLAKPEVILEVGITKADNLFIRWHPSYDRTRDREDQDFYDWVYREYDVKPPWERPENEICFLHEISLINKLIKVGEGKLASQILSLIESLYRTIKNFLTRLYGVVEVNKIEKEMGTSKSEWDSGPLLSWKIYNIRQREEEEFEAWFQNFEENYSLALEDFFKIFAEAYKDKDFSDYEASERASRFFKKQGIKLTPGTIRTIVSRIKKHRERLFYRFVTPAPGVEKTVIEFPSKKE